MRMNCKSLCFLRRIDFKYNNLIQFVGDFDTWHWLIC